MYEAGAYQVYQQPPGGRNQLSSHGRHAVRNTMWEPVNDNFKTRVILGETARLKMSFISFSDEPLVNKSGHVAAVRIEFGQQSALSSIVDIIVTKYNDSSCYCRNAIQSLTNFRQSSRQENLLLFVFSSQFSGHFIAVVRHITRLAWETSAAFVAYFGFY